MNYFKRLIGTLIAVAAIGSIASQNSTTVPTSGTVSGLQMAQAINNALDTVATMESGSTNPGAVGAYRLWADTGSGYFKQRDAANSNWVSIAPLLTPLATTNASSLTSGTVATARLPVASTGAQGVTQLSNDVNSTSLSQAATINSVNYVYGLTNNAQSTANTANTTANAAYSVAIAALPTAKAFGVGQSYHDVTAARSFGSIYTNTTVRPMLVYVNLVASCNSGTFVRAYVNGSLAVYGSPVQNSSRSDMNFVVPPGNTYQVTTPGCIGIGLWTEFY